MKITFSILLIALFFFLPANTIAQCCNTITDCGASQKCGFTSADALQCANSTPTTPGYCETITPENPDFSIPVYANIPNIGNDFNFNRLTGQLDDIGDIISAIIPYFFAISGLTLFFYLLYGAFTILSGLGNPEKIAAGSTIITRALIGIIIIFASYWIAQIIELILDINII